jgi:hypothetical protein
LTLEQRVQKTLKLYDSKQGQRIWAMNKYVHELDDKKKLVRDYPKGNRPPQIRRDRGRARGSRKAHR